jgi:hypothetical protein
MGKAVSKQAAAIYTNRSAFAVHFPSNVRL